MPPNHDSHMIQDSSKTQRKIKITPTNNLHEAHNLPTDQQRLADRTFIIVQYVIHCFAGRNIEHNNPSPVAMKVRELTHDIVEKHDVYNTLCVNLGFTTENLQEYFNAVAANIFEDGLINWGRLIALLGFSVKMTEYFRCKGFGNTYDNVVVELTTHFIVNRTGQWIQSRGGWGNIITHFDNSKNEAYYSPHNTTWFKGFLVTATATIGLGAIFAMAK